MKSSDKLLSVARLYHEETPTHYCPRCTRGTLDGTSPVCVGEMGFKMHKGICTYCGQPFEELARLLGEEDK